MKCRNCRRQTKAPNDSLNWRVDRLCATCAHEIMPEKYRPAHHNTKLLVPLIKEKHSR